jgi:periplasmic mercuric ion binding protein
MKKLIILCCLFILNSYHNDAIGQVMAQKPVWITIKSANLRCWICKDRLESYMNTESKANYESGISQVKFNLFSSEMKILYHPDRITPDDIRVIINNAGFDADEEKATEASYKKLPPLCKRNEDGGGPSKGKPCHLPPDNY